MPPPSGCIQPPAGCPSGSTWDQSTCTCQGGTTPPPTGTYNMPACAPGVMPTAATPCQMPPPPSCPSGQWYDYSKSACTSSTTNMMPPATYMPQCTPPMQPFPGPSGQSSCYDPATLPTCSSTVTSTCKPQGWVAPTMQPGMNQYPAAQTCTAPQVLCPSLNNTCSSTEACAAATPVCGPNVYPTAQNPCKQGSTMPTTTTQGDCWNSTSANFASQECTQMRAKANDTKIMQPTQTQCQPGNHWAEGMGCVKDIIPMPTMDWQQSKPGECPQEMQSCPDQWNPSNTVCMPKKIYWDSKTGKDIQGGRLATCEDFKAPTTPTMGQGMGMGGFGGFGQGSMPFGGQGMQGQGQMQWFDTGMKGPGTSPQKTMNPCEFNPNDPFCKAGFDFNAMQDQYKFDESQFQPQEYKMNAGDIKRELKNLKMDVKNWTRDVQQVRQQLKEIGRESSGFACPAAIEVSTIAQQYEDAINQVNALNESSSQEEIQKARALGDFIRGKWQDGEQVTEGLQQKLYGGPMDEDGNRKPGKMESLNVCRELSNVIREANSLVKEVSRESKKAEKSGAPKEILSVFAEVLAELQEIATNPIGVLQKKGVSLEEISGPWQPDPEVCSFGGGFGGGPGFGPMPPMEGGGGFGGGPDFGQMNFGDMDPSMMEKMKEKFMEMQKGEGNFQNFQEFNPFGASVLSAQAFGDEDFGGDQNFGPQEPPEECMPPVQRYLSPHRLMRKLDEARMNMGKQFESTNVCNMLDMAKEFLDNGKQDKGFGGPPQEVIDLVENGIWQDACDSNDTKTLDKIKSRLMRIGPPGGNVRPGGKKQSRFGGLIDIDKLVEDKLNEKLGQLFGGEGEEGGKTDAQMEDLEARIADLQSKLDDAAKTIFALNERLSDMATKLASAIELNEQASKAINSIAKFTDENVQQSVTAAIDTLATKAEEVKAVLPAEMDKLIDATINSLVVSPPSSTTLEDISDRFNAIASYASSGAKSSEIIEKAKDELAEVAVLNGADVGNKVAEGIVASRDTADLSQWYAVPALNAVNEGFASISKENPDFKPAESETKCAAITRIARISEKATGEEIDMSDKTLDKSVPGAPNWCLPFLSQLQEQGVPFAMDLRDPNAPIDRGEVAMLIHQAIGDQLPDPASYADYITPDMKGMPVDMQNAIAEIRFNGIMDTTDGTNFSPFVDFNRAQNALVSVKAFEAITATESNQE